ncbi:MAG TPA: diguanylate cyclase [Anaerolineales bacterium]
MNVSTNSEALDALKDQLGRSGLGALLDHVHAMVILLDSQAALLGWNAAFDGTRSALPGTASLADLLETSARAEFEHALRDAARTGEPVELQLELALADAAVVHHCSLIPIAGDRFVLTAESGPGALPGMKHELDRLRAELSETRHALEVKKTELQAVLAQTDEVAHTDSLTLLPNRRWIIANLQRQVTFSERYGTPLSVSLVDIDNFKEINDTYGHTAGDQVLRFIASEMRDGIRQPDEIGRYGGDEFLLLLPHTTVNAAAEQANRLCKHVRSMPVIAGKDAIRTSISIGIAQYRPNGDDWRSILERADQALYQAKHNGRDQWAILKA